MPDLILLADLGGTNLRFSLQPKGDDQHFRKLLVDDDNGENAEVTVKTWEQVGTLEAALEETLSERGVSSKDVGSAVIAYAGPVEPGGDQFRFTNANYSFSRAKLADFLSIEPSNATVINDFYGQAMFIDHLATEAGATADSPSLFPLHQASRNLQGAVGIVGPGTGLGIAAFYPAGSHPAAKPGTPIVFPGEGGNVALGAKTKSLRELLPFLHASIQFLRRQQGVSDQSMTYRLEDVLSGQGLSAIYGSLWQQAGEKLDDLPNNQLPTGKDIATRARAGDGMARAAFDVFFDTLAMACTNIALQSLTYGGVFVPGGVVQKNIDLIDVERFASTFVDTWGYRDLLRKIPVNVVTEEASGLAGAALYANVFNG